MNFAYRAYKADGTVTEGSLNAASAADAERELRASGLFPEQVRAEHSGGRKTQGSSGLFRKGRLRWLSGFTRQLAVLTAGGTQLVDALEAIERQTADEHWRSVVAGIRGNVEHGESLADAMATYPAVFDGVYRSLIAAGESGGDMQDILRRLASITRAQQVTRGTITGAMLYPALLLTVCLGVLAGLVVQVLPRFEELFETLNAPLPPSTAALMAAASLVRENILLIALGAVFGVVAVVWFLRSESGRRTTDHAVLRIPVIGAAVRSFTSARFARVTGVLLHANVPLLETLAIARDSSGNSAYEGVIDRVRMAVERGDSMSDVLRRSPLFDQTMTETVRNGEQTGRIGDVLVTLADMMDEDNAQMLRSLTSILEPMILSLLGLVVGSVALSLFLPLFDLTASTGAGS